MFQLTLGFSRDSAQGVRRGGSAGVGGGGGTSAYPPRKPPRKPPFTFLFQNVNKACEIGALFVALDALFLNFFFLIFSMSFLSPPGVLVVDFELPN